MKYGVAFLGEKKKQLAEAYSLRSDLIDAEGGLLVRAFSRRTRQLFPSGGSTFF
jgi:hypothetical protein